jgi:hypothetical protein
MIRVINAQGFPTLTNEAGVAFQMPMPLLRELFRRSLQSAEELRAFLEEWGGDPEGRKRLLEDEFSAERFKESITNFGVPLESLHDLRTEQEFFEQAYGRKPRVLFVHPNELGVISTTLAKEGWIPENNDRRIRDNDAVIFLRKELDLDVLDVDDALLVGEYR